MKKSPPPPAPARTRTPFPFWRLVAIVSLVANAALVIRVWRAAARGAQPVSAAAPGAGATTEPAGNLPVTAGVARELAPYLALGSFVAENNRIPDLAWTKLQFDAFVAGERASFEGRGVPLDDDAKRLRDEVSKKVQAMLALDQPDPAGDYFRTLREKEGVTRTASGLHYRITEPGDGPTAGADDTVVISFTGRLPDGTNLPSLSRVRTKVRVRDLLPGLAEGVQLLRVGGKALIYLPPALAFTEANRPAEVPPQVPVIFFLELHDIEPAGAGH